MNMHGVDAFLTQQASMVNSSICGVQTALKFCTLTSNQFENVPMLDTTQLRSIGLRSNSMENNSGRSFPHCRLSISSF